MKLALAAIAVLTLACLAGCTGTTGADGRAIDFEVYTPYGNYKGNTTTGTLVIDARTFFQQPQLEK
jgi:hypothetical protein